MEASDLGLVTVRGPSRAAPRRQTPGDVRARMHVRRKADGSAVSGHSGDANAARPLKLMLTLTGGSPSGHARARRARPAQPALKLN